MIKATFVPIIIYYFVHQISAMLLLSLVPAEQVVGSGSLLTMLAKMMAMMIGGAAVFSYYLKEKKIKVEENIEVKNKLRFNIIAAAIIVLAGAAFSLALNYLFSVTGLIESSSNYSQVAKEQFSYGLLPALLFYGVVSPIVEEEVFRGIVYNSLRRNIGIFPGMLGSALLFGAIHGNMVQMLYGTIMGIVMAFLYEKYGKLLAPILFHSAANIAIYICVYFV